MGVPVTGNGRRESFAHAPMPRMTNTYMLAGDKDPQEIIASVKRGLYAVNFGGGQVDIVSGKFVFSASEAYMIEDGKVTYPVKGATLIGNGPDALTRVSMIGNDLALDTGVGTCGKEGQSVPVGVGQPTLAHRRAHRRRHGELISRAEPGQVLRHAAQFAVAVAPAVAPADPCRSWWSILPGAGTGSGWRRPRTPWRTSRGSRASCRTCRSRPARGAPARAAGSSGP